MEIPLPAIITAIASLAAVVITIWLTSRREVKAREKEESRRVNLEYLNPLRLYLVENYFRLLEIQKTIDREGKCEPLLFVENPREISSQSAEWFNGEGCYLVSTSYFTACLFYYIRKVREDFPYLRIANSDDTKLITLLLKVSLGFLRNLAVFYATQPSIGNDLYLSDEKRLMTYREFCELLQNPDRRVWFDRLFNYYIDTGKGENTERIGEVLKSIRELSEFLDFAVGGGKSIRERLISEGIEAL